ncbi:MAG: enoyl-CoA hydratase-related protein, partial [Desulfobulbia bacterium]
EMQSKSYMDVLKENFLDSWDRVSHCRKPVIAAVSGYALGGGCELAMMCDFIVASDTAKFGQPEITLGVMPGVGGTQRLTRLVGKSKAMDMYLTGRMMEAEEAERSGLVSRIVPANELLDTAVDAADKIAEFSQPSTIIMKESINRTYELPLSEGLLYERRLFHSLFATEDQKEGMQAFVDKRSPKFSDR